MNSNLSSDIEVETGEEAAAEEKASPGGKLDIRELILLSILALISVAGRQISRLDLNIPGHAYIFYLLFLIFGSTYIPKRGAATFMGLAAGIFGIMVGSKQGVLDFIRFFVPALVLEGINTVPTKDYPLVNRIVEGILVGLVMLTVKSGNNLVIGRPLEFVLAKAIPGLIAYPIFGIVCGIGAHYLAKSVREYTQR